MGPTGVTAHDRVLALCDRAVQATADGPLAREARELRARMDGPLRVAIAGRVKAGKSTLLNALVGERLAPTDAGECTRIVTFYREGLGYDVHAVLRDGAARELQFRRNDGALDVQLGDLDPAGIEHLDIAWPASTLHRMTLVDTPGLASLDSANSVRTQEFLALGDERSSEADAVIYLMRHLHRTDADFLDAFLDRSVGSVSPVNAIAVLSRADEIGAARPDAMASAERIAERYRLDPDLRTLCATVIPIAGLLAETGLTLREEEAALLRTLSQLPAEELSRLLLSSDRFCAPDAGGVGVEGRRALLDRLGMFGVRLALAEMRGGRATTASELAALLVRASGLERLRNLLTDHFLPRAQSLKARATLGALRRLARRLVDTNHDTAIELGTEAERIEASAHEFAELRLAHLVMTESVRLTADEADEMRRLTGAGAGSAQRMGLDADAPPRAVELAALAGLERWRTRAEDPLSDRLLVEAAEIAARSYEGVYSAARTADRP